MFPVVQVQSVLQVADCPDVVGVAPDLKVGDGVPAQITPVGNRPLVLSGGVYDGFQIGEPVFFRRHRIAFVRTFPGGSRDAGNRSLPVLRHVEDKGAGVRSGPRLEFLFRQDIVSAGSGSVSERPKDTVEVAHADFPDGCPGPFARQAGGHLGQQPLHRDDGRSAGIVEFSGHRQSPFGERRGSLRVGRDAVGKRTQPRLGNRKAAPEISHVHQGIDRVGNALFQIQSHRFELFRIVGGSNERAGFVSGQGDSGLLCFDVRGRQERPGLRLHVRRPEQDGRFLPRGRAGYRKSQDGSESNCFNRSHKSLYLLDFHKREDHSFFPVGDTEIDQSVD